MHNMVGYAAKTSLAKGGSANYVEVEGFPNSQLGIHVVKEELKGKNLRSIIKDGKSKIFSKVVANFNSKEGG